MTLLHDLRSAIRGLRRDPAYAALAVLSLGFGLAACTLIFSLVDGILIKPLAYRDPGRLVAVNEVVLELAKTYPRLPVAARHYFEWSDRMRGFSALGLAEERRAVLTGLGDPEQVEAARVSSTLLPMIGARVERGRLFLDAEDQPGGRPVVILAGALWRRRYGGDPAILGRAITVDGTPRTVVGILADGFRLPSSAPGQVVSMPDRAQIYTPIALDRASNEWGGPFNYAVVARLRPDRTIEQARSELNILQGVISTRIPDSMHVAATLTPLQDEVTGRARLPLLVLMAAVGAVLLVVCVNLANLALARGAARTSETAIRLALGASRWQLLRAALVESLCLSIAGGALGVVGAWAGLRLVVARAPVDVPRLQEVSLDLRVIGFAIGVSVLTGVVFGLLPAWRAARVAPQVSMGGASRTASDGRGGRRTRNLLVAVESALSVALLVVAGLLVGSFVRLLGAETGFRPDHVVTSQLTLPRTSYPKRADREIFYRKLLDAVGGLAGVADAGLVSRLPLDGEGWVDMIRRAGDTRPMTELPPMNFRFCSPGHFRAMGIPVVSGRAFAESDRARPMAVISEAAARLVWPNENPVGQMFDRGHSEEPPMTVAGVVRDVSVTPGHRPVATVYIPYWETGEVFDYYLVVRQSGSAPLAPALRRAVWGLDRDVVVGQVRTMEAVLSASVAVRRFELVLTAVFAGAAMLLACLGIYGVVSWSVARRRTEIGIRLALGGGAGSVRRMIVSEGMRPVIAGLAAGLAAAWMLGRMISSLLFGIGPHDAWTMAAVSGVVVAVAAAACDLPARRATREDPLRALRDE